MTIAMFCLLYSAFGWHGNKLGKRWSGQRPTFVSITLSLQTKYDKLVFECVLYHTLHYQCICNALTYLSNFLLKSQLKNPWNQTISGILLIGFKRLRRNPKRKQDLEMPMKRNNKCLALNYSIISSTCGINGS